MLSRIILKIFTLLDDFRQKAYLKASIRRGLKVGQNNRFIQVPDFGSEPYLIEIGNNNLITTGIRFITHDGGIFVINNLPDRGGVNKTYKDIKNFARIQIADNVFIGNNCILLPGTKIGNNCVLGAGSVLTSTMPDNSVYAGIPAKYICSIEEYAQRAAAKNTLFPRELDNDRKALDEYLKNNLPHTYRPVKN